VIVCVNLGMHRGDHDAMHVCIKPKTRPHACAQPASRDKRFESSQVVQSVAAGDTDLESELLDLTFILMDKDNSKTLDINEVYGLGFRV